MTEAVIIAGLAENPKQVLSLSVKNKFANPVFNKAFDWLYSEVMSGNEPEGFMWALQCQREQWGFETGSGFVDAVTWSINKVPPAQKLPENLEAVAKDINTQYQLSLLKKVGMQLSTLDSDDNPEEIRIKTITSLAGLEGGDSGIVDLPSAFAEYEQELQNEAEGINSPAVKINPAVDEILGGGIHADTYSILAGRPGMGKTTIALCAINQALEQGWGVHFISLEMSATKILRILMQNVMSREYPDSFTRRKAYEKHKELLFKRFSICDLTRVTLGDIVGQAQFAEIKQTSTGAKGFLLVLDYLQLVAVPKNTTRDREIAELSNGMITLRRILNQNGPSSLLVLSQLSREVERRQDKRPMLSDLRDSGTLEQDADVVIFLFRQDYYDKNNNSDSELEVDIAKHRDGRTGVAITRLNLATKQWYTISDNSSLSPSSIPQDVLDDFLLS